MSSMDLAKRFWFEGAVRGNPLAQLALGDEIMFEASESGEADARLLAAVLFGLAAQQGNEQAMDSLKRLVEFDVAVSAYETQEDFLRSPVVQVAEAASCRLLDQ
jgi:TPR repeat protein